MNEFVQRQAESVIGFLSGFDRLLFRGTIRLLANARGLMSYLWSRQVLLKELGDWSQQLTEELRSASKQVMVDAGRTVQYLPGASASKEDLARAIARREGITRGPVCLLEAVEPCWSYEVHRSRALKKLVLEPRYRKCLHQYPYWMDERVGLMHVRLQTWLPLGVRVCMNGREWLCRQLHEEGIDYTRRDNCLTKVSNMERAQALLDEQLRMDWPKMLSAMVDRVAPAHRRLLTLENRPLEPYWSCDQSEWASDVMFRNAAALASIYPRLVSHGMRTMNSHDVMRFLGKRLNGNFQGEVISDLRERVEGMRVKHRVNGNSVKMYDKQGSVLRVETTINDAREFKVYRGTEADPGKKQWRRMRKGVADLHRRAQVSESSNQRYLSSLASVQCPATVKELIEPLCRSVTHQGRRHRGLRPLQADAAQLLSAVSDGRWTINGLRNADLREALFGPDPKDPRQTRRRAGQVTRKLALLRAHGLIRKVGGTRRWMATDKGRQVATLLTAASDASPSQLLKAAA
jgi:hypothetical protein